MESSSAWQSAAQVRRRARRARPIDRRPATALLVRLGPDQQPAAGCPDEERAEPSANPTDRDWAATPLARWQRLVGDVDSLQKSADHEPILPYEDLADKSYALAPMGRNSLILLADGVSARDSPSLNIRARHFPRERVLTSWPPPWENQPLLKRAIGCRGFRLAELS